LSSALNSSNIWKKKERGIEKKGEKKRIVAITFHQNPPVMGKGKKITLTGKGMIKPCISLHHARSQVPKNFREGREERGEKVSLTIGFVKKDRREENPACASHSAMEGGAQSGRREEKKKKKRGAQELPSEWWGKGHPFSSFYQDLRGRGKGRDGLHALRKER